MIDHLRRAFDHLEWANRRALEAGREPGHGEARRLLAHVLAAEGVWLERLRTGDSSGVEIWPEHSFEECEARLAENAGDYRSLLEGLSGDELQERLTYRNSEGRQFHTPVGDVLHHVLVHGEHHRGQIAIRLRDAGHESVNTDYITFVRGPEGRPEREG